MTIDALHGNFLIPYRTPVPVPSPRPWIPARKKSPLLKSAVKTRPSPSEKFKKGRNWRDHRSIFGSQWFSRSTAEILRNFIPSMNYMFIFTQNHILHFARIGRGRSVQGKVASAIVGSMMMKWFTLQLLNWNRCTGSFRRMGSGDKWNQNTDPMCWSEYEGKMGSLWKGRNRKWCLPWISVMMATMMVWISAAAGAVWDIRRSIFPWCSIKIGQEIWENNTCSVFVGMNSINITGEN